MSMAMAKVHWGKPILLTEGGAELPVTNTAVSVVLLLNDPGKYSLDWALGVRLPAWVTSLELVVVILTVPYAGLGGEEVKPHLAHEGVQVPDEALYDLLETRRPAAIEARKHCLGEFLVRQISIPLGADPPSHRSISSPSLRLATALDDQGDALADPSIHIVASPYRTSGWRPIP